MHSVMQFLISALSFAWAPPRVLPLRPHATSSRRDDRTHKRLMLIRYAQITSPLTLIKNRYFVSLSFQFHSQFVWDTWKNSSKNSIHVYIYRNFMNFLEFFFQFKDSWTTFRIAVIQIFEISFVGDFWTFFSDNFANSIVVFQCFLII